MNEPNKDLLRIRLNHLEEDCREHPRLAYDWNLELARARREAAGCKNRAALILAKTKEDVRRRPEVYGFDKRPGEDACREAALIQDEYQNALDQQVQAEYEAGVLEAFSWALVDRKVMLELEVKLHGQTYWSKPDTSGTDEAGRVNTMKKASGKAARK